jgi:hypothetical protein
MRLHPYTPRWPLAVPFAVPLGSAFRSAFESAFGSAFANAFGPMSAAIWSGQCVVAIVGVVTPPRFPTCLRVEHSTDDVSDIFATDFLDSFALCLCV